LNRECVTGDHRKLPKAVTASHPQGWLQREEEKVDAAISRLMALQTGAPVRAALNMNDGSVKAMSE
jgi:hypothetical protein